MMDFEFRGKTVRLPSQLEELSGRQYIRLLSLTMVMQAGLASFEDMRDRWVSFLLGTAISYRDYEPDIVMEVEEQLEKLNGFFEFTPAEDGVVKVSVRLDTKKQMLRELDGWTGPGDMLDGMTFGEFTDCLIQLKIADEATSDDERREAMRELTRRMYHAPGVPHDTPQHRPSAPTPPDLLVFHAVTFFTSIWQTITSEPVNINGEQIPLTILFRDSTQKAGRRHADDRTGWRGIAFEVARDGVFGRLADVDAAPLWDVLLFLYKCKFDALHTNR